jgi:hypothetical protein
MGGDGGYTCSCCELLKRTWERGMAIVTTAGGTVRAAAICALADAVQLQQLLLPGANAAQLLLHVCFCATVAASADAA